MKKQKGITLIALIITIIIMLILVAVTVNIALNGGLFEKAKTAASDTQREADREELLFAVVSVYDGINENNLKNALGNGWTVQDNGNNTYTCTKTKTGNSFIVDQNGQITIASNTQQQNQEQQQNTQAQDEDYLKTYFMGALDPNTNERTPLAERTPVVLLQGEGETLLNTSTFELTDNNIKYDGLDVDFDNYSINSVYVRYNYRGYSITLDTNTGCATNVAIIASNIPQNSKVGKYVQFGNNTSDKWIVLYDENELGANQGAQLIMPSTSNTEVDLGYDSTIKDWAQISVDAANEDSTAIAIMNEVNIYEDNASPSDVEKLVYYYNHCVEILNDQCANIVGNKTGLKEVRCVGSNPIDKNNVLYPIQKCTSTKIHDWPTNDSNYEAGLFYNVLYNTDENYIQDINRLKQIGYADPDNHEKYFLASRHISEGDDYLQLSSRYFISTFGEIGEMGDFFVYLGNTHIASISHQVKHKIRPVIVLNQNVLGSVTQGDGSINNPYIIE